MHEVCSQADFLNLGREAPRVPTAINQHKLQLQQRRVFASFPLSLQKRSASHSARASARQRKNSTLRRRSDTVHKTRCS